MTQLPIHGPYVLFRDRGQRARAYELISIDKEGRMCPCWLPLVTIHKSSVTPLTAPILLPTLFFPLITYINLIYSILFPITLSSHARMLNSTKAGISLFNSLLCPQCLEEAGEQSRCSVAPVG